MKNVFFSITLMLAMGFLVPNLLYSQIGVDLETGLIRSGYNDVRIPGDTGTLFSLSEDLEADDAVFYRISLNYSLGVKCKIKVHPFV